MTKKRGFSTNKTHLGSHRRKKINFVILSIALIMCISLVSAGMNWDNIKDVTETIGKAGYNDIEIYNSWIIPNLIKGEILWSGSLKTNTARCLEHCSATQTITLYEEGSLVDEVIFKKINSREEINIDYQIYIGVDGKPYQVDDAEWQCSEKYNEGNKTYYQDCIWTKIGSHTEYENEWEEYEIGSKIPAGTYEVKLEGTKNQREVVDWIYKTQGKTLDEWAIWGTDANVTLISPANNSFFGFEGNQQLIGMINVTDGSRISNYSLWLNESGIFKLNQTQIAGGELNSSFGYTGTGSFTSIGNDNWRSMGFNITSTNQLLDSINLTLLKQSGTPETCWVAIAENYTQPNGNILSIATFNGSKLSAGYSNITVDLPDISLTALTQYWISINCSDTEVRWEVNATGEFPQGGIYFSADGGVSWTSAIVQKTNFKLGLREKENNTIANFTAYINKPTLWNIQGCDTGGLCGFDFAGNRTLSPTITLNAESYSDPIPEGSEQTFYINVTNEQTSLTPYLVYDGISYLGSFIQNGSNFSCERTLDIPPISADINVTFFWSFLMADASVINSTSTNLTVNNFAMDNCTVNNVVIMNLTLFDENNNTYLEDASSNIEIEVDIYSLDNVLIGEYNKIWTNKSNVSICIGNLTNANYNLYVTTEFSVDDYVHEFYFIDKKQINTTVVPINISLMDLLSVDSTSFLFNYFDEDGLKVSDPIIHTHRKYIGEGLFREIERSKQNDDGDTIVHLIEEDVIYYFQVSQNDTIIYTSQTYTALCDTTPCTITLEESGGYQDFDDDWDLVDNGAYTISASAITRTVNLTFDTTTPSTFNLTVYKLDSTGEYEYVGSGETTGTTGTIEVVVPDASGNISFFSVVKQDDEYKASYWNDFTAQSREYFGSGLAVFLGLLIVMCLGLMAISEGSGTIVFVILGMFLTVVLGLIDYSSNGIGIGLMIYFIITGGIIIWKLTRRNR